ncbi:AraC family transcriptional regulator [Agaribacterium haliotis]|uniref:AraC family transcriptional regulator n=1 Tax=Agaribacterium haliotis TaxID=2013869 RepID=UPI000BB53485|nr:helix-turn-helix domain-containing protein [Agaribacterium haliotis]
MLSNNMAVELLKLLYISSFSLGLWACLSTVLNKQSPGQSKALVCLFIVLLLLTPLHAYLSLVLAQAPLWLNSLASTQAWAYGPLMLALVFSVTQKKMSSAKLALHFLPFAAASYLHYAHLEWLVNSYYKGLLLLQTSAYLVLSIHTIYRYRQRIRVLGREFKNSRFYWMLYLIAGLFALPVYDNLIDLMLGRGFALSFFALAASQCLISLYVSTIALLLLLQPDFFTEQQKDSALAKEKETDANNTLRYVELSPEAASELEQRLSVLMSEHRPYLDPSINLAKLSSLLGVSSHQLSELLNIHLQTSFYDYLNTARYQEAIRLMHAQPSKNSVSDIAYMAGFNNRNSFYRVFKQHAGLTPGEYRKQLPTQHHANSAS